MSKFSELCEAYDNAQNNFETYKNHCHNFAVEFVDELRKHFEIPDRQFTIYKIDENNNFDLKHGSLLGVLTLTKDSLWHFGVGFTVCRTVDVYPEELILLALGFRKENGNTFYLKHTYSDKEYKVEYGKSESYNDYFEDLFKTILASYNGHLQQFIGEKTTRKLGYNK